MLRKAMLTVLLLSALAVVAGAVVFPPIHRYKSSENKGALRVETYDRYWSLLPPREWGVTPYEIHGCGGGGGTTIRIVRFGIVGLEEDYSTHTTTLKGREMLRRLAETR